MKTKIKRNLEKGFTLIELLIVVVILGILAAVVIPQLSGATDDARVESLKTNLSGMRSAIALYKQDHGEYPGANVSSGGTCGTGSAGTGTVSRTPAAFADQLTMYTDANGVACTVTTTTYKYGPYLKVSDLGVAGIPKNSITEVNTVIFPGTSGDLAMVSSNTTNTGGWLFDELTGKIIADDHTGTPLNDSY